MSDTHEALFKLMQQYRVAKVALYPDGSIRTAIAMPPEVEPVKLEPMTPEEIRREAEAIAFAHVEGFPAMPNGVKG